MARHPRLDLPGIPQHIVQRGNNRLPCFLDDTDRRRYLTQLREALLGTDCALHAYVLMDNHVHMLVTPPRKGCIARMMQKLGRQYVGLFNARHGRTGSLWEGRYKSCLVDSEDYVLRCHRYIDLNPIRARMIDDPAAYRWSSCPAHCGTEDALLTPHPSYLALGRSPTERAHAYRTLLNEVLTEDDIREIRIYLQQQRALGRSDFQAMVEAKTQHFARTRPAHRPRKNTEP
ncbi:transposase [Oleiagrimonas sp. MCCC 1A03011]|uniref:transposase n=1 Tax=Oleiagrimonas sp. MCCC 1A03011 TaxID=1926883 RepID=UPI000DC508F1|nr:transposase [Oleiagrimonas sp. MCCC 1A03011]RAP56166.1 transposase [Oleiagrimonas sp. MCCC 1A03011]